MRARAPDGTTLMFLFLGLVPLVGLALLGHWPRWEVGAGTVVVLLALHGLRSAGRRR